MNIFMNK